MRWKKTNVRRTKAWASALRRGAACGVALLWACDGGGAEPLPGEAGPHDGGMQRDVDVDIGPSLEATAGPDAASDGSTRADAAPDAQPQDAAQADVTIVAACTSSGATDQDKDGFPASTDCNDCDPNVNPAALDVPGSKVDEDCSGVADDEPASCDGTIAVDASDAAAVARSVGLCRPQAGTSWGLKSASWKFPDGTVSSLKSDVCAAGRPPFPLSHGVLDRFGPQNKPRDGAQMLALSSGVARAGVFELGPEWAPAYGESPSAGAMCTPTRPPKGFPIKNPSCPPAQFVADYVQDGIALELEIKVPSNATELSFDFNFFSTEFPKYVCSGTNDQFVVLLSSGHSATPANGNITFDGMGNAICVDSVFMQVCRASTYAGRAFACPRGTGDLAETGFGKEKDSSEGPYFEGGSTSWLNTRAPVVPGETIKLRFAIWDTLDSMADSTVLIDHLRFNAVAGKPPMGQVVTMPPVPPPVDTPKTEIILL